MNDDSKTGDNNQFFSKIWRFQIKVVTLHSEKRL